MTDKTSPIRQQKAMAFSCLAKPGKPAPTLSCAQTTWRRAEEIVPAR